MSNNPTICCALRFAAHRRASGDAMTIVAATPKRHEDFRGDDSIQRLRILAAAQLPSLRRRVSCRAPTYGFSLGGRIRCSAGVVLKPAAVSPRFGCASRKSNSASTRAARCLRSVSVWTRPSNDYALGRSPCRPSAPMRTEGAAMGGGLGPSIVATAKTRARGDPRIYDGAMPRPESAPPHRIRAPMSSIGRRHGWGGAQSGFFFGTSRPTVLHQASCPVLVVRGRAGELELEPRTPGRPKGPGTGSLSLTL